MPLSYAFVFPMGLTLRAYWEIRGYVQTLIHVYERQGSIPQDLVQRLIQLFSNRSYMYLLWPRKWAQDWYFYPRAKGRKQKGFKGDMTSKLGFLGRFSKSPFWVKVRVQSLSEGGLKA